MSRPVPWKLLFRRYGLLLIAMVVLVTVTSNQNAGGLIGGLLLGGVFFFGMSWVMSKFGYAPKTMAQMREEAQQRAAERAARGEPVRTRSSRRSAKGQAADSPESFRRPTPPPTRRTASGVGRHPKPKGRR